MREERLVTPSRAARLVGRAHRLLGLANDKRVSALRRLLEGDDRRARAQASRDTRKWR